MKQEGKKRGGVEDARAAGNKKTKGFSIRVGWIPGRTTVAKVFLSCETRQ